MTPWTWPVLALMHDEPDQVPRLRAFREKHPQVVIGTLGSGGPWQARIPEERGETVFTRYRLKDLLDQVSGLLGEPPMALRTTRRAGRGGSPAGYR